MAKNNNWPLILSIIAVILALAALFVAFSDKDKKDYVTQDQLTAEHTLVSTAVQTDEYRKFYASLTSYHSCITEAERSYFQCVNNNINVLPNLRNANCDGEFVSKRDYCNSQLRIVFG